MSLLHPLPSRAARWRAVIHSSFRQPRILSTISFHQVLGRTTSSGTVLARLPSRHFTTTVPTMPPSNRKRSSASSQATGTLQPNAADVPTATEETSNGLRRSKRRKSASDRSNMSKKKGGGVSKGQGEVDEMEVDEKFATRPLEDLNRRLDNNDQGAVSARQHLEAMELSFKKDIKSRRLQIEQSVIEEGNTSQSAASSRSRRGRHACDAIYADRILLPADDKEELLPLEPVADEEDEEPDELLEIVKGANRSPAVHSDYLPLPWRGRLGYACLNTYLRAAKPPVFSSRTCRIASIIEHRHPLADPSQPEHPTKNRPDRNKQAEVSRGQSYVESLGLANARDIVKMLRWNEKFGIRFMRLSSEMFPFASHEEYGYDLAPFASQVLADAGKVAAEFGHRLTTHPGQFTQLGSPRSQVVTNALRDLKYHDEMLSLLKLPPQQDRDAVMILHMGGTFPDAGGKPETLDRFRQNYQTLSDSIKRRLVLENDDVSWSVHDLLPICEELNIPLVLDYHHHNIIFDADQVREGTYDISQPELMGRIARTWTRKGIRQKMHYSEPCYGAVTPRDRRKHSPRVATLPPCPPDMDLMIEAKDKEQAVFELMRRFKLPGFDRAADMVAHERQDQDRPPGKVTKTKKPVSRKRKRGTGGVPPEKADAAENEDEAEQPEPNAIGPDPGLTVSAEDFGMGGPLGRVYWPLGFEDWLSPKKREKKAKADG